MAVEHVVFVAGVFIGQGHEQGLPGHFARLSRPHQSITYMFFQSHYMLGRAKGRVGAQRGVKHASKKTSETAAPKGKL